jgi:hypothetical protein
MPKRSSAALLTALLTASVLGTVTSSPASAATPCVTKAEFGQVAKGMTQLRVAQVFGTDGTESARTGTRHVDTLRSYVACPKVSSVSVFYRDQRVTSKVAHWGATGLRLR